MPNLASSTKDPYSSSFILPSLENSSSIFKNRLFNRELLAYKESKKCKIKINCTSCSFSTILKWPINTTNLKRHYRNKHSSLLLESSTINTTINNTNTSLNTSFTSTNIDSDSNIDISSNLSTSTSNIKKRSSYALFSKEDYRRLLLNFIIANNLSFSIVDSNSFNNLLKYLKDDLIVISRRTLKEDLDLLYNNKVKEIKALLKENNSKFSLTLDEQTSSNNLDFLAITIYYYNNSFKLESYLLGFKNLNSYNNYSGDILYNIVNNILKQFNIRNKILAITRDNTSSINSLLDYITTNYKEKFNINIIDNRCAAHILNIVSNTLLTYLFFINNNSKVFLNKIESLKQRYNSFNNNNIDINKLYIILKALPTTIRSLINSIKNTRYLKNNFKKIIRENKALDSSNIGIENLLKDNSTRQLSTYNMLEILIYFKEEISLLLDRVNNLSKDKRNNINIEITNIDTLEQNYIIELRNILEVFRKPTIEL